MEKSEENRRLKSLTQWCKDHPRESATRILLWESQISQLMPEDFKDWWNGDPKEWPVLTKILIKQYRSEIERLEDALIQALDELKQHTETHNKETE